MFILAMIALALFVAGFFVEGGELSGTGLLILIGLGVWWII
jgi:hypothetical protein